MNLNKYALYLLLSLFISLTLPVNIFAQCDDIETACLTNIDIVANVIDGAIIIPQDINTGLPDGDCPNLSYEFILNEPYDEVIVNETSIIFPPESQDYIITLNVYDDGELASSCWGSVHVVGVLDCDNDITPPDVICINGLIFNLLTDVEFSILATSFNGGTFDDCSSSIDFRIEYTENSTGEVPLTTSLNNLGTEGTYNVNIWAGDEAGNWSFCQTYFIVRDICGDIETACIANIDIIANSIDGAIIIPQDINTGLSDSNCPNLSYEFILNEPYDGVIVEEASIIFPPEIQDYSITLNVYSSGELISSCWGTIHVVDVFDCDNDMDPTALCQSILQVSPNPIEGADIGIDLINIGSYDYCSDISFVLELAEDYEGVVANDSLITLPPLIADYVLILHVFDEAGNTDTCSTIITIQSVLTAFHGSIFVDNNDNCALDEVEMNTGFEGWKIRATQLENGIITETFTNEDGSYYLIFPSETANAIQLEVILPNGQSSGCSSSVILTDVLGGFTEQNFAVQSVDDCSYLTVDVSTPFLRRCFPNIYSINYGNHSSFDVENATINVLLDPNMELLTAGFPYTTLTDGSLLFDIGTIPATSGGLIHFTVYLSCDTEMGQTHCISAKILPFDCDEDGFAQLRVEGECDETLDEVRFKVTNIGTTSTTQAFNAIVVEDVLMYMQGDPTNLGSGESVDFNFPANGATWRFEVNQDPSYPYGGIAASFIEGCGGFTPNMVTQFSLLDPTPNITYSCQENIGSWDPNDKQAFPRGYGEAHFIKANTPIEYLIRFQNTGTDTAFTVVVEDQLSEWLDPSSLRMGASSHPCRLEQKENGLLLFHFDNILLPDSTVNLAASNGFVKFYIDQVLDAPLGTTIDNSADIYFDFNAAVVTNTVRHTIGENFIIIVGTQEAFVEGVHVDLYPNPLQSKGQLILNNYTCKKGSLQLFDLAGRMIKNQSFIGNQIKLDRNDFASSGIYFFRIMDDSRLITQGKLVVE